MNAERLKWLAEQFLEDDSQSKIRKITQQIVSKLNEISGNPQAQNLQTDLSQQISSLEKAVANSRLVNLTSSQKRLIAEIGGDGIYGHELVTAIKEIIARNGITIQAGVQEITKLHARQKEFFEALEKIVSAFEVLKIQTNKLKEGEAEIGFLLPDSLYKNRLDKLGGEVADLHKLLSVIIEVQQGQVDELRIRSLAASQLLIYMIMGIATIKGLAMITTWGLDTIERVLRLRKLVHELGQEQISSSAREPIETETQQIAENAAKLKAKELLEASALPQERKNELSDRLVWALLGWLARQERGMAVEIRLLPPAAKAKEGAEGADALATYNEVAALAQQLHVPPPVSEPILQLPGTAPEVPQKRKPLATDGNRAAAAE